MTWFSHVDWFAVGWLVITAAVIVYSMKRIARDNRRYKEFENQIMAERLAQVNQPAEVERNEKMRREGKIW